MKQQEILINVEQCCHSHDNNDEVNEDEVDSVKAERGGNGDATQPQLDHDHCCHDDHVHYAQVEDL